MPLAVNTPEVATPAALVVAVATPPAKVPLAPLAGAVKVTVAPLTGLPPESSTVTCRGAEKAVPAAAFCGVPAVAAMVPVVAVRPAARAL